MKLTTTINSFTDNATGHVNITFGGEVDGEVLQNITVGANVNSDSFALFNDFFGDDGSLRREEYTLNYREPIRTVIEVDEAYASEFMSFYSTYSAPLQTGLPAPSAQ